MGGALRVPKEVIKNIEEYNKYQNWADTSPPGYPQLIEQGIANFVNLADDYQKAGPNPQPIPDPDNPPDPDPLITPPLYGRWHAAVDRLLTRADGTPLPNDRNWIHELNLDPRFRVAGGFGTRVIQKNQEEYMNIAWQQVGDVLKANHLIRLAQLTNEVLWQWHTKIFQPLVAAQPDKVMLLSAPLQKRVLLQNTTLFHQLKTSLVPPVAVSPQMRRIMRPRARTVRMLPFVERNIAPGKLVTRLNAGEVVPAPPKITPPAIFTEDVLADQVQPPPQPKWLADLLRDYPWLPWATLGLARTDFDSAVSHCTGFSARGAWWGNCAWLGCAVLPDAGDRSGARAATNIPAERTNSCGCRSGADEFGFSDHRARRNLQTFHQALRTTWRLSDLKRRCAICTRSTSLRLPPLSRRRNKL